MALTERQFSAYYDGNTHACVTVPYYSHPSVQRCGKIVPPPETFGVVSMGGSLKACVRTPQMRIECGYVQKLYTPNLLLDNWGWFAGAAVVAFLAYRYWMTRDERAAAEAARLAEEAKVRERRRNDPVYIRRNRIKTRVQLVILAALVAIIIAIFVGIGSKA